MIKKINDDDVLWSHISAVFILLFNGENQFFCVWLSRQEFCRFVVVKKGFGIAYVMMNFSENLRRDRKKEVFELSHRDREFICGLSDEEKRLSVCV